MFADASVRTEIDHVGMLMTRMLTWAMDPDARTEVSDDDIAIAKVIGDVWLSALVGWVTGRASVAETSAEDRGRGRPPAARVAAGLRPGAAPRRGRAADRSIAGRPSLRWSQLRTRSASRRTTTRFLAITSTKGRISSVKGAL